MNLSLVEPHMDPDDNLAEQRRIAGRITRARDAGDRPREADVLRLVELMGALDEWILHGGYLPASWERRRTVDRKAAS